MLLPIRTFAALAAAVSVFFGSFSYALPGQNAQGSLVLVNKQNRAPSAQPILVLPDVTPTRPALAGNIYMRPEAATALEALFQAARDEAGFTLYATSGYRSYATQRAIYERRSEALGERRASQVVAKPGYSEHQTGLAMDIEGESTLGIGLEEEFGDSPEGIWVAENAHRFGFIVRYKRGWEDITGYAYEPWHIRYVGVEHATAIAELNIPFEEYLELLQGQRTGALSGAVETEEDEG
ncbi:D-alanyl-D-alanine carboxypeptidase family protein [Beduinella massiliensis]|uniref:D-alanyl-D-alanine carboxypeptidase family protein n=1 Tax=Beduinella massiliensis TaxID=1852363 RepID=UPI000C82BE49